jgi:N-acetylglucosaminyl-diphospho-decaprenol L-rhamnosyltransferase
MKLSIVIICWNDLKVIADCLKSIYAETRIEDFEVIVSDNGSTDGSIEFIQKNHPSVRVLENGANLGFAKGNNVGIHASRGEYVLILNPDTIMHDGTLDKLVSFADRHPEAGAFGCRTLNPGGSYQMSARPFPTIRGYWMSALCLRPLGRVSKLFLGEQYPWWKDDSERAVDWLSGHCVMFRRDLLNQLKGFDEQFFYHFEEVDLCRRVWNAGFSGLFTPEAVITHIGGQSVSRFPIRFELEKLRNCYRYFYKHFGPKGCQRCRQVILARLRVRQLGYSVLNTLKPTDSLQKRLEMYRVVIAWNKELEPIRFVETGEELSLVQLGVAHTQ